MKKKVGLIILDGWGIGDKSHSDAIFNAKTPYMDALLAKYPNATLKTYGENVGLPEGQMGNSEVGHMNIGAGRIVYQELTRINKAIKDGEFDQNPILNKALDELKTNGKNLHLMGLVSDGGVHSHFLHLFALCDLAVKKGLKNIYIHAITDGRDCDPHSGIHFMQKLIHHIENTPIEIATVSGRYYAMDRDNRWQRIAKAYHAMVNGIGNLSQDIITTLNESYENDISDEFLLPTVLTKDGNPVAKILPGDTVINFNFRTDRPREISIALTQQAFPELEMQPLAINYVTMTRYDSEFENIKVLFEKDNIKKSLGQVLSELDKTQLRAAETEKYPHVTFFFNGGREEAFTNESRVMVASPKVATYDLQPEMSSVELKDKVIQFISEKDPDFLCVNFANPDMVGHTGVYEAIVSAVETVDGCLKEIVDFGLTRNYEFIIIADHGNADFAVNADGSPNTAHSLNPVPVVFVSQHDGFKISDGILADVAPTILRRMKIATPMEMTGKNLIELN